MRNANPVFVLATLWSLLPLSQGLAQVCTPGPTSNEAKLLAFFEVPTAFSQLGAPRILPPWTVSLDLEVAYVPSADSSIQLTSECFQSKSENSNLTSVFARPRLTLVLPAQFAVEVSYVPPVSVNDAMPHLFSAAVSRAQELGVDVGASPLVFLARGYLTVGQIEGPITCSDGDLQQTEPFEPCYGTEPSRDTYEPNMFGLDGTLALTVLGGSIGLYAGGGIAWERPRFQVGFVDLTGAVDTTQVEVNLTRGTVFGGASWWFAKRLELSAEVYSIPADGTTIRLLGGIRFN